VLLRKKDVNHFAGSFQMNQQNRFLAFLFIHIYLFIYIYIYIYVCVSTGRKENEPAKSFTLQCIYISTGTKENDFAGSFETNQQNG
jgi:hypothetical protein